eukprot:8780050-Prorocentrum_lima.AAC.1
MYMRDPEEKPISVGVDGSTRRTSAYKVELLLVDDDHPDQDYIDREGEPRFDCFEGTGQATGADIVGSLQDIEDPA